MEAEGTSEVVIIGLDDKDHWCYGDKYDKWINGNTIIKQQNNPNHLGERSNFEEDKKNCSTKIFLRKTQLLKYFGQDIKSQEACNFGYFNNYLKKYGTFAGEGGSWRYQCPMDYSSNGKFEDNVTIEFIAMFRFVDLSMQLSLEKEMLPGG
ncbi:hypothetical protein LSH36_174g09024 [Paralvinella palmiformis]|uniref:Uncharacterized protein n=1 Tax=Paralvinella palmiformis TaxID=53620 RepID=A0AAD9JRT6_9ANNE|nr:hypothetical protein LSH36_174g09024 [Paralvinella palmiformis]